MNSSALQQAQAIRQGKVTSEALVRGYLERIRHLNPTLQAFVMVAERKALAEARAKDANRTKPRQLPAFYGVPIGIKDMNFVRGMPTRMGSRSMPNLWSPIDDVTVSALRRAGFVILGKLATSEAGALPITEPRIHPPTRNPFDLSRTPGGSSGGSAAAVAAGLLPIAHGSDGGGSIRIPAALCGLFGFKPSRGQLKNAYRRRDPRILYTCGPITRSVDDAAALLDAMSHSRYPTWSFACQAQQPLPSLKIRYTVNTPFGAPDPEHLTAMQRCLDLLANLGHDIAPAPDLTGTLSDFLPLWQAAVASTPLRRSHVEPFTGWLLDGARQLKKRHLPTLHDLAADKINQLYENADIWVSATTLTGAPQIGAWQHLPPEAAFEAAAGLAGLTAPANITGRPACSLPAGLSSTGLPIGLQLVARPGDDGLLLAVARTLEQSLGLSLRPNLDPSLPTPLRPKLGRS